LAEADDFAWGAAASWDGTWQAVANRNIDLVLNVFMQYDFSGNSHFWGNFAEDRLQYSVGLTGKFGTAWEANVNYAGQSFSDSVFETQDTINVSFNYKF
jgi:outer membrane autotransporter protein